MPRASDGSLRSDEGGFSPTVAFARVPEASWTLAGTTEWVYQWDGALEIIDADAIGGPYYPVDAFQAVPGSGTILDVDLEVTELLHSWVQDMKIYLWGPDGTESLLHFRNPQAWSVDGLIPRQIRKSDLIETYYDDEAEKNISAWDDGGLPPFTGFWQPYGEYVWFDNGDGVEVGHRPPWRALSRQDGKDMQGLWTLHMVDTYPGDVGSLNTWKLIVTIDGAPLPSGVVGEPYEATPNGLGTSDGYTDWSVVGGNLPAGLSMGSDGLITGTPEAVLDPSGTETFTFTVAATSGPTTASAEMSITIYPDLQLDASSYPTGALPSGRVGDSYEAGELLAAGGDGTYEWTLTNGVLPQGLDFDGATGTISGVPEEQGQFPITVTVVSGDGQTASVPLGLFVDYPFLEITAPTDLVGLAGEAFYQNLTAVGGAGTDDYVWSIVSGPTWLGLDEQSGTQLSGPMPTTQPASLSYSVTVEVTSPGAGMTDTAILTINWVETIDPLAISTTSLPDGTRGESYTATLQATGGDGHHSWSWTGGAGSNPGWLTLDEGSGQLTGTPPTAGQHTVEVTLTGRDMSTGVLAVASVDAVFTITVVNPPVTVTTEALPEGRILNAEYPATQLQATGGDGQQWNWSWSWDGGANPGLDLDPASGQISGWPTEPGTFTVTVQASSGGEVGTAEYTLNLDFPELRIETTHLTGGATSDEYFEELVAVGGDVTSPYTWSFADPTVDPNDPSPPLPPGLVLDGSAGTISGTPSTPGRYENIVLRLTNGPEGYVQTAEQSFAITIVYGNPQVPEHCAAEEDWLWRYRFATQEQCYRYVETGLDSRFGEYPELVLEDVRVPRGSVGDPYSLTFTASGGADDPDSYYWWYTTGLPGWLALEPYYETSPEPPAPRPDPPFGPGTISGIPMIAGSYSFRVTVQSFNDEQEDFQDVTIVVPWKPGGDTAACESGAWEDYGFLSEPACRHYVVTGIDSRQGEFPDLAIQTDPNLPNGQEGVEYSYTLEASGNVPDLYTLNWSVQDGSALPDWLGLSPNGSLSGTPPPDSAGDFEFWLTVTRLDTDGNPVGDPSSASQQFFLRVLGETNDPQTPDDCKKGGWEQYGFANQGLCIQFVNTGKDSRGGGEG